MTIGDDNGPHPGELTIDKNDERFKISIECRDLQPGRAIKSDEFFIGKRHTGQSILNGKVFAENLPQPKEFSLTISATVTETSMSMNELLELAIHATSRK